MLNPEITDSAIDSLKAAAETLQEHYPQLSGEAIGRALQLWLEGSIEQLAEDAAFHCVEGRDDFAMNRKGFRWAINRELEKATPVAAAA